MRQVVDPAFQAASFHADQAGIAEGVRQQGDTLVGGDQRHREFPGVGPAHGLELPLREAG